MNQKVSARVYMSDLGFFEIPDEIELAMRDTHRPSFLERLIGYQHAPVMQIAPLPENPVFWEWLKKQENAVMRETAVGE